MSRSRKKNKYSGAKSWDVSCRNHGRCSYCADGRQHFDTRARFGADQQLEHDPIKTCDHPLCKNGYWPDGDACAACDGWGYR